VQICPAHPAGANRHEHFARTGRRARPLDPLQGLARGFENHRLHG